MLFNENIFGKQYLNKCTYTITSLCNYYTNTIGDMQNEKNFYDHCNVFEYNHDFEQVFLKNDDVLLEDKVFFVYESMYVYHNIVCGLLYEFHEMI